MLVSGVELASGGACMMNGNAIPPWVGTGVNGTWVGGAEVDINGTRVGTPVELLSWQPLNTRQSANKNNAFGFICRRIFNVFTMPL